MQIDFNEQPQTQDAQTSRTRGWPDPGVVSIPIPFLNRTVGLGESIAAGLARLGARPCGGCKARADAIDRVARFTPWD